MAESIDKALENLAIPIPSLSATPPPNASDIPPVAMPDVEILTPDFGTPRKRTRKRKTEPTPEIQTGPVDVAVQPLSPAEIAQIGKALGLGFRVVFAMIAAKRGEHWQLAEQDEMLLGGAWSEALAPWLATSTKYVPIAVATLATIGVIVPRIDADAKLTPPPEPIRNADTPPIATESAHSLHRDVSGS